MYMEDIHFKRI